MLKPRGFTLIELSVTVAIVATTVALGLPGLNAWMRNLQIRGGAEALLNGLQLARGEAVRRNTPVSFTFDATSGWTVGCVLVQAGICPATIQSRVAQQGSTNVVVASTNVAATSLQFDGTGRIVSGLQTSTGSALLDVSAASGICAAAGGTLKCLRVIASPFGQLRMCDPALTQKMPGDARAC